MKWIVKADSLVDDSIITWEVEADSPEQAEAIGYQLALASKYADSGSVDIEPKEEDKQLICNKLLEVLHLTRNLHDVEELIYDPEQETVTSWFTSGYHKTANVACDSGTAMIMDIIRQIN